MPAAGISCKREIQEMTGERGCGTGNDTTSPQNPLYNTQQGGSSVPLYRVFLYLFEYQCTVFSKNLYGFFMPKGVYINTLLTLNGY